MTPIEFLEIYKPEKKKDISSVKLSFNIRDREKNLYCKILINHDIHLTKVFPIYTQEQREYMADEEGGIFDNILIHTASTEQFSCLDEFMYYLRYVEEPNLRTEHLIKYPYTKGALLNETDFRRELYFYIDEMFMNKKEEVLLGIPITNYKEGYFFVEDYGTTILGCNLTDKYLAMSYYPYT